MLLAVDTSTQWIGLALLHDDLILNEMIWKTSSHHSVELAPAVHRMMQQTGIKMEDLQALAVATGPGSFTSLRIGMALVKGLALSLHIPVIGIPTLEILATAITIRETRLVCALQAGRGRLAVRWYKAQNGSWVGLDEPTIVTVEELEKSITKPTLVAGELNSEERQTIARRWKNAILVSPAASLRRPSYLANLAVKRWEGMDVDDTVALSPIYLHVNEEIPA
jgi:tRNA threonylcarbamoyladenosine biosynthesis protein TsaB